MRVGTSVAVFVLLSLAACIAHFSLRQQETYAPRKLPPEVSARLEADARRKLAFESLIERLPRGKSLPPTKALSAEATKRWEILDQELAPGEANRITRRSPRLPIRHRNRS